MPLLEITDLKKSYRGPDGVRRGVLDVPSFTLEEEEQVALEGRSGCGKTTFLNLIAGILTPDRGSIRLGGEELFALSEPRRDRFRARNLGYVFQAFHLLGGYTVLENVLLGMAFGRGIDRPLAGDLLESLGLGDHLRHRPHQLSIGQQQRVAVARALAARPRLVLADEPTGSLDPERAGEALELLRRACREHGAALLLVSHDRELLGGFDRRLVMGELDRGASGSGGGAA